MSVRAPDPATGAVPLAGPPPGEQPPPGAPDPSALRAVTVALPAWEGGDVDALAALGEVFFADRRLALGGTGVAAALDLPGGLAHGESLAAAQRWLAAVPHDTPPGGGPADPPGPALTALGALPFDRAAPGRLLVPALTVRVDEHGNRWATALGPGDALPDAGEVADRAAALLGRAPRARRADGAPGPAPELVAYPAGSDYEAAVARALERTERGELAKVVLARTVEARFAAAVTAPAAVRRLRAGEPSCAVFSFPVLDGGMPARFLGASPELLVRRHGAAVVCHPLAGTVGLDAGGRPGDGAGSPGGAGEATLRLLGSAKDRDEHRLVVEAVAATLLARCAGCSMPDGPSLVRLGSVAHLGTELRGTLRAGPDGTVPSVLELLAELHPTPAVGGVPREAALACIADLEQVPRGHWAGPVGWVDAGGDGQWMIGIRSATVRGSVARCTAGAGIVAGSDPRAELEETTVKLVPVLEALAPGASRLL